MNYELIKLTPRLHAIAELIPRGKSIADIGTDHAYIPAYLALSGISAKIIAADILPGPLKSAEATVAKYNRGNAVSVRQSDGLQAFSAGEVDVFIIAGMGGVLISEILAKSPKAAKRAELLILQPMTAQDKLRKFLYDSGYKITAETLAKEGSKIYNILCCVAGEETACPAEYFHIGARLIERRPPDGLRPPLFEEYIAKLTAKFERKLKGLQSGKTARDGEIAEAARVLEILRSL